VIRAAFRTSSSVAWDPHSRTVGIRDPRTGFLLHEVHLPDLAAPTLLDLIYEIAREASCDQIVADLARAIDTIREEARRA
jgi:hypothetical protein